MTLETALRALSEFEARVETLTADNRRLSLKVQDLQQQLAATKRVPVAGGGPEVQVPSLFGPLAPQFEVLPPADSNGGSSKPTGARRSISGRSDAKPRGRRPLDPSLPRETIRLPDPPESERIDPVTGSRLIPHHVQVVEVLARKPAVFFVKRLERRVWVSRLTGASVATPWPPDVLPRSGVDASIMAHIGAAHFAQHMPYYRIEQQLERTGVSLPRNTQVSLMARLESLVEPVVDEIKRTVLGSGYVHLDATPIDVCDRARPGKAHTAHLWAYRARSPDPTRHGLVWFDYQATKTPSEPAKVLEKAKYRGVIQTDGAAGLDRLRPPDVVTHLGCWAHARKYVAEAVESGEENARPYLCMVRRLFAVDVRSREVLARLAPEDVRRERVLTWRDRFSRPLAERLFTRAAMEVVTLPPKTALATALGYLLGQRESLMRCVITPGASLDNNPVENAIRPIKLGAKNWLFVGDPGAGPRLANLYTLIENCRQAKIDPEAYLIALIRALGTPAGFHAPDWLPGVWKARLAAGILT